ncbi:AI-2E family transporter [Epilithonimonas arachidiradicis]|uniref:AI-2E family transporter n=1 Tax=Epilithonimonas arachidiradicis TaxID=1617282 RepID=A0A420DD76_9FLAO|nr:AI-2E family transporter [Epilithonimonas arachidiradicis]RKE89746.1 putative PurR-regulated permease PerM [Epilithonimonas arachidiradicis]GGG44995.1 AI-2E family transporter [Epilithonimonas arachidiradicis]
MSDSGKPIDSVVIKQVALILLICVFVGLICWNLALFIPSFLGAVTLYIICRKYNFYLIEEKNWKPWLSATVLMLASLIILILPVYFTVDQLVSKLGNAQVYMQKFNIFLEKIHQFIFQKVGFDILSKENIAKVTNFAGTFSTKALSTTVNTFTVIISMYFVLYFMFVKARLFERMAARAMPFKRANTQMLGDKFVKLVMANAIGIPVVALGQGVVALIGYYIFGAPSPMLLFALTALASMLPVVGAAIVYLPVGIFMIAEGQTGPGVGILIYGLVVVGLTDNLLRFTLLKRLEDIHPLITVFGIIMGMNIFGFMGLIFGPILMSITVLLIQVYRDEFSEEDAPPPLQLPAEDDELENKTDLII